MLILLLLLPGIVWAAAQTEDGFLWPRPMPLNAIVAGVASTERTFTLDADGEMMAAVFPVPETCSISKIGFRTGTVTTGDTMKVSLQAVDATNGDPDGTVLGGGSPASGTVVIADGDDDAWKEATLSNAYSATKGDLISAVIEFNSYVAGNLDLTAVDLNNNRLDVMNQQYNDHKTGGSWSKSVRTVISFGVMCNDSTYHYIAGSWPIDADLTSTSFANNSTPDERANSFQVPFPASVCGLWAAVDGDGDYELVLYEGTTEKDSPSIDKDIRAFNAPLYTYRPLATPVAITENTAYYVAVKPSSTTSVTVLGYTVNAAAIFDQMQGGSDMHLNTRTDAGAWSATTTSRILAGVEFCAFDDATGGGPGCIIGSLPCRWVSPLAMVLLGMVAVAGIAVRR